MSENANLGFKVLTLENWRQADPTSDIFVTVSEDGPTNPLNAEDWAGRILDQQLNEEVPLIVRKLFEVAKGALCYGAFFYPLFTVGSDQLFRLFETALQMRCSEAPSKAKGSFKNLIAWAVSSGVIPQDRAVQWDCIRHLRNAASHLEDQWIQPPTSALTHLNAATELLNELFRKN